MSNIVFSVIAEIDNSEKIFEFLENIQISFKGFPFEIILVGTFDDKVKEDLEKKEYGEFKIEQDIVDCVSFITASHDRLAEGLNVAKDRAAGENVVFTETSCLYHPAAIKELKSAIDKNREYSIFSLSPRSISIKGKNIRALQFSPENIGEIDLEKSVFLWNQCLYSIFIKREALFDVHFDGKLTYEYKRAFVADLYSKYSKYFLIGRSCLSYAFSDTDYYNYMPQYNIEWYNQELINFSNHMLQADSELHKQILMDFIRLQYACNLNDRNKSLIQGQLLKEYKNRIKDILDKIDDRIIVMYDNKVRKRALARFSGFYFLTMKYGDNSIPLSIVKDVKEKSEESTKFGMYVVSAPNTYIENLGMVRSDIRAMNFLGSNLVVDAEIVNMYYADPEDLKINIIINGESYDVKKTKIYCLTKFFGETVKEGIMIQFTIPTDNLERMINSYLSIGYLNKNIVVPWEFKKPQSRLYNPHKYSYWVYKGRMVRYNMRMQALTIEKSSKIKCVTNELKYWYGILRYGKPKARAIKSIAFRLLYFLTIPYFKNKNVWMTFDQLFKGGDNGEYFYRYVSELDNKAQKIYYVINRDTKEYKELIKKYNTVLHYNSWRHKLITLHTKIMFATRADAILYGGYFKGTEIFFRGLLNCEIVCLQHGLSIQQIAQYQNRLFDNLKYYFCVSKYEVENISQPIYGYDSSVLCLTGAPRYDGLISNPKKQIIITPTWRRNVTAGTNTKGSNHEYSVNFKHTKYYEIYNSLINDDRLIQTAKKYGYKLIYLIHPILSPQIDDFDKNDYVKIVPGSKVNYEKILTESALMLTDHSGIMYDFAYQRKPVVYYHPEALPPQYDEGGLKYETMGFGPICKNHEQVVDVLCKFIENGCSLDSEYERRINDFFEFDDYKNCERVYNAAIKFQSRFMS